MQGRGSAANSAVCYSLGITAVDPVAMDLLFERFLSEERGEWPDIDLDLPSGDRREQVIQHVYARYGQLGAAMTANVITYRGRSAAREVGKVLGIDPEEVDRLAKVMHHFEWRDPHESFEKNLRAVGIDPADETVGHFAELWTRIQRLPRHLGQHSGGMVICQGRLDEVVPLENASMPGRVVIQWDKEDCADMGIVKVDLLGLGMMAVLQDSFAIVNSQTLSCGTLETAGRVYGETDWRPTRDHRHGAPAARRSGGLSDAAGGRHDRPVPGRIARADGDAAAPEAEELLRHRGGGRDHPARADRRQDGPSVSVAPHGTRSGEVSASVAGADPRSARSACRCSRSSCCGWRWSRRASPAAKPKSCGARSDSAAPKNG